MGIDTRAFGSSVERPADTAAERGELRTIADNVLVNASNSSINFVHTNNSGTDQFLLFANASQEPRPGSPVATNLAYLVRVQSGVNNIQFKVTDSGRSLVQTVPSIRIRPGDDILVLIINETSSDRRVDFAVTFRQG
jgi:hypothetical protein